MKMEGVANPKATPIGRLSNKVFVEHSRRIEVSVNTCYYRKGPGAHVNYDETSEKGNMPGIKIWGNQLDED